MTCHLHTPLAIGSLATGTISSAKLKHCEHVGRCYSVELVQQPIGLDESLVLRFVELIQPQEEMPHRWRAIAGASGIDTDDSIEWSCSSSNSDVGWLCILCYEADSALHRGHQQSGSF